MITLQNSRILRGTSSTVSVAMLRPVATAVLQSAHPSCSSPSHFPQGRARQRRSLRAGIGMMVPQQQSPLCGLRLPRHHAREHSSRPRTALCPRVMTLAARIPPSCVGRCQRASRSAQIAKRSWYPRAPALPPPGAPTAWSRRRGRSNRSSAGRRLLRSQGRRRAERSCDRRRGTRDHRCSRASNLAVLIPPVTVHVRRQLLSLGRRSHTRAKRAS